MLHSSVNPYIMWKEWYPYPRIVLNYAYVTIWLKHCKIKIYLLKHNTTLYITYRPIFQVNFISYNYEGEIFWVPGTGLDKELVPPAVQWFECVWHGDVKHQNTTVCPSVERYTQRLESLLSCGIPYLQCNK